MEEQVQTRLINVKLSSFETKVLEFICKRSSSLYNQAVYFVRKCHEMTHPGNLPNVPYEAMAGNLKDEWNYTMLYSQVARANFKVSNGGIFELQSFASIVERWRIKTAA